VLVSFAASLAAVALLGLIAWRVPMSFSSNFQGRAEPSGTWAVALGFGFGPLALAAIVCFIGGPLRMLYAAVFEEGAPNPFHQAARPYVSPPISSPQFGGPVHNPALPPPPAQSASGWRSRPITAELANPPSVTENTTRLLDKEDRSGNQ